jgi:hypothetical protein
MSELLAIPGLEPSSFELLEAVGYRDFSDLVHSDEALLSAELERANRMLQIAPEAPSAQAVAVWIAYAREVTGEHPKKQVLRRRAVDHDGSPTADVAWSACPLAIPLPGDVLREGGLSPHDIPEGSLFRLPPGDMDIHSETRIPVNKSGAKDSHAGFLRVSDRLPHSKFDIDMSRLKSVADISRYQHRVPAARSSDEEDRVTLIRSPRKTTNEGVDPRSRRYIRGVLHSHPLSIYLGAALTVLLLGMIPAAVLSALLLLLSSEQPEQFFWVPPWLLWFPIALPLLAIAWAIVASSGQCRICGQKLFIRRAHRKHVKAHYLPSLGYVLPLCLHILLFRWFRCTHCGTPVRLKE